MKRGFAATCMYFFRRNRKETVGAFLLLSLAGLAEGIGIASMLPFIQLVLAGADGNGPQMPEAFVRAMLWCGLQPSLFNVAMLIGVAIFAKAGFLWLAMRHVSAAVAHVAQDLREQLLLALLKANWPYFVSHSIGSSLNAIAQEAERGSSAFLSLARLGAAGFQVVVYAIGASLVSLEAFGGGLVIGIMLSSALWLLVRLARTAGNQQTVLAKGLMVQLSDMLQGIKPLRAMNLENKFVTEVAAQSRGLQVSQYRQLVYAQALRIFHEPLMLAFVLAAVGLAVGYAGMPGTQVALLAVLFSRLLTGMNQMQGEYQRLGTLESALWSLQDAIADARSHAESWPGHGHLHQGVPEIRFKAVSFSHGDKRILEDADLTLPPCTFTAIVGSSGCGKTTALDLLSGFQVPTSGEISIGGVSLSLTDLRDWRSKLGFVPQEVFLFNDTIFENVTVGRSHLTESDVWWALASAGAEEFVRALPDGLSSMVGEGGRRLSGGQRQRIAIARAIVHRPQLLLLDEPTSALDKDTERSIFETVSRLARKITVVAVSHNHEIRDYASGVFEIADGRFQQVDAIRSRPAQNAHEPHCP